MAGLMILVSVFAAGAFAKRVATKQDVVQLQKEAFANGPSILPVQSALPLRPAVMPRASVRVGMAMQEGGNSGRNPADEGWKGPDTSTSTGAWMSVDIDQDMPKAPDWAQKDFTGFEAAPEKEEKYTANVRQAGDSLRNDIPQILQFESKGKTPMDWDIYTDDFKTDLARICEADDGCDLDETAMLVLFSAVAAQHIPSWTESIKGKDSNKASLQELRVFIDNFVEKAEVTGQDWCTDEIGDWCVVMEELSGLDPELSTFEGDKVITSNWKAVLRMNTGETKGADDVTTFPEAIVTITGLSRFHINDEGKIYRHSLDEYTIGLNQDDKSTGGPTQEEAKLFLQRLAGTPRRVK